MKRFALGALFVLLVFSFAPSVNAHMDCDDYGTVMVCPVPVLVLPPPPPPVFAYVFVPSPPPPPPQSVVSVVISVQSPPQKTPPIPLKKAQVLPKPQHAQAHVTVEKTVSEGGTAITTCTYCKVVNNFGASAKKIGSSNQKQPKPKSVLEVGPELTSYFSGRTMALILIGLFIFVFTVFLAYRRGARRRPPSP